MIRVGITGQAGFVGTHLYHTLGLWPEVFERIPFEDSFLPTGNGWRRLCGSAMSLCIWRQ